MRALIISIVLALLHVQHAYATETVKLRVIHADALTSQLAVLVDGQITSKPLRQHQSDTMQIAAQAHTVQIVDTQSSKPIAASAQLDAQPGHCYTMVVTRETTGPASRATPIIVPMECKPPETGKANATFVLASPNVEKVDVYAGWFKIISNLKKGSFEGPTAIPAGDYTVVAKDGSRAVLGPIDLSPKAGHSYTIVAFDAPGSSDGELTHRVYDDDLTSGSK